MENKDRKQEQEYSFLKEKIVPHRRHKVKKMVLSTVATAFLATVFGVIARVVFITTEGPLLKYLGIDTTERTELLFPTESQSVPEITPTKIPIATPTIEPTKAAPSTTVIEKIVSATAKDYGKMFSDIRLIAQKVQRSLMTVTAIHSGKDWMDEINESRKNTTGMILGDNDAEMLVLCNYDRVKDATSLELAFYTGETVKGYIYNYDEDYNLAVIAVSLKSLTENQKNLLEPAVLGESYTITPGSPVLALGQPNGHRESMELGMITGKGSSYYIMDNCLDYFTTDVSSYAESDGVILNLQGEVIGWITQNLQTHEKSQVSTAVGITRMKPMIEKLVNKYDSVLCGLICEDLPASALKKLELKNGVYVVKSIPDSPAFEAGIKSGDIITMIDDKSIGSVSSYAGILNNYSPDVKIAIHVLRQYKGELKPIDFKVSLKKKRGLEE